ncbi:MAG: glycosyltransferase family 1 protein, partial [Anaerolineae bacterium]
QRVLLDQARWFHAQGYPVIAAFFYDKENLGARWRAKNPFPVVDLGAGWGSGSPVQKTFRLLRALRRLWLLLRRERVQVIETFTPHSNLLGIPIAWLARVPVRVPTHHTKIEGAPRILDRLHGWLVNSPLTSRMVAVSSRVRQMALSDEGVRPERVDVILNGVDPPAPSASPAETRARLADELGIPPDVPLLLAVGRLVEQKGFRYLLAALPAVWRDFPRAHVLIAGEGHLRGELEAQVRSLELDSQVHFPGIRGDVPDLLAAADVFVLPSLWEGLPIALLEAMGAGRPVVATRVEGVEDVLENGVNGLLVPPGDSAALAEAITRLLADADLRGVLGRRARQRVEQDFTIEKMCRAYEQLFVDLMAREA